MTELDLARLIAAGTAPSPSPVGDSMLVALRISGTGISTRPALGEKVFRDPLIWLSPETLARVAGLSIILDHPPDATLDNQEFAARSLGAILYPYVADRAGIENAEGPDLWGVGRVFLDADSIAEIAGNSTSPSVAFSKDAGNQTITLDDGTTCLVEGAPDLIDHLAIVTAGDGAGVWDKGGPDRGIRIDLERKPKMDTETKTEDAARRDAEHQGQSLDKMLTALDSVTKMCDGISRRLDAIEEANKGRKDADPEEDGDDLDQPPGTPRRVAADDLKQKDREEKVTAQARADGVAVAFGERAPPPMMGETGLAYRKRLLRGFQKYSTFKNANLNVLAADAATFGEVETKVYADALEASKTPSAPAGMRVKRTKNEGGHTITEWFGASVFKEMMPPSMRATAFITQKHGT